MIWLVGVGGSLGAAARYGMSQWLNSRSFPLGTWVINIIGSFVLGICLQLYLADNLAFHWWLFLGVGLCGGFTTFSTFGTEVVTFIQENKWREVLFYIASSVILSAGGAWIGFVI